MAEWSLTTLDLMPFEFPPLPKLCGFEADRPRSFFFLGHSFPFFPFHSDSYSISGPPGNKGLPCLSLTPLHLFNVFSWARSLPFSPLNKFPFFLLPTQELSASYLAYPPRGFALQFNSRSTPPPSPTFPPPPPPKARFFSWPHISALTSAAFVEQDRYRPL